MIGNNILQLTREDMEAMSTKRLLNVKRSLYNYYHIPESECDWDEPETTAAELIDGLIAMAKDVLNNREHIEPNKKGKKA